MKAEERTISNILTDQICYEIPSYQRPYSWGSENAKQLLDDIWEAYQANDNEYFIGSVITIEREPNRRYDVVDGQQRLTTLNLVLARFRDHIEDQAVKADLDRRILPRNVYTGAAEAPRLLLRKRDQSFFRDYILESKPIPEGTKPELEAPRRHLFENGQIVDDFCKPKTQLELKLFANYMLNNVYVVFVTTPSWKSAYRLFNVLNARGMPLSNSDLIKNSLFGKLGADVGRSADLEAYWLELEEMLGLERMDSFFGHHRTSVAAAKARGALHEEIEALMSSQTGGPFAFMKTVLGSAQNYMRIIEAEFNEAAPLRAMRGLHRVEYDEWIPPLLAFLNKPASGITEVEYVILLEKITMQNWVRRLGRTARLTVYYQLINAINAGKSADEIRGIFSKNANNEEFLSMLGGEVYGKPFDTALLLRLEETVQDESVTKSYSGRLTIEHVLPQALKDEYWKSRFDETTHAQWIHRLGNLALLCGSKNYKAQYYAFDRKKAIYNEQNMRVSFDLTKEICDQLDWTLEKIQTRQNRLLELAKQTWSIF